TYFYREMHVRRCPLLYIISSKLNFNSTQINAPENIASKIRSWGLKNISDEDLYEDESGFGRESEIHVTVKYGLHTDSLKEVEKVINNFGTVNIKLGKISQFESEKYDVLKIDVDSP